MCAEKLDLARSLKIPVSTWNFWPNWSDFISDRILMTLIPDGMTIIVHAIDLRAGFALCCKTVEGPFLRRGVAIRFRLPTPFESPKDNPDAAFGLV